MNQRLQQFINAENISQSQFADNIGVARASVSHIIAGRNKPGFDFILGMTRAYPALNVDWLITGKGKMYRSSEPSLQVKESAAKIDDDLLFEMEKEASPIPKQSPAHQDPKPVTSQKVEEKSQSTSSDASLKEHQHATKQRSISRIVIFYDDNTYQELK